MKNLAVIFVLLISLFFSKESVAQISHGGTPVFLNNNSLRNSVDIPFIEMPSLNTDSINKAEEIHENEMRGGYLFAHKFETEIKRGVDGTETILPDGTKVWQVGIKSEGAYSINLLFSEFDIPAGGKLFIYNTDHSHIIGSFDSRNNNPQKILPIRPVSGDAILIEYSEPAEVPYEGRLTIGEVNHDYKDILRRSPATDHISDFSCMPDVLCSEADKTLIRSSVLLMINGNTACSGTLINNTKNDGHPYILTAVHCLNTSVIFPQEIEFYEEKAGTIVAFFNYNRPVCGTKMKGTEEMSMAVAYPKAIIERKDIALLELAEKPPLYYNAYYAGWNVNSSLNNPPYTNIHHPNGAVTKYGRVNGLPSGTSWSGGQFDPSSHWRVTWETGATYGGSSGSALFDGDNLIVGGLTGGSSVCRGTVSDNSPDAFFAFHKGWTADGNSLHELKPHLDPLGSGTTKQAGFDPNGADPFYRISNMNLNLSDTLQLAEYKSPDKGYLFGNSNRNITEFAEEFNIESASIVYGAYFFIPSMPYSYTSKVEVSIYSGSKKPETLLATQEFHPQYLNYSSSKGFHPADKTTNAVPTENFVLFDKAITVDKKFFISYKINYSESNKFAVYNSGSALGISNNTAWLKDESSNWLPANQYSKRPITTSLAIQPLLQHTTLSSICEPEKTKNFFSYDREANQIILSGITEKGILSIYNTSGQLLKKIPVGQGENTISVNPSTSGTIGIMHFVSNNGFLSGKFVY